MRSSPSPTVSVPLSESTGYATVLDNERVRAYRVVLEPGQSTPGVTLPGPSIQVAGTGGKLLQQAPGGEAITADLTSA